MDVDLIFKIAAIGILVAVFEPAAHSLRAGGAGYDDDACGAHRGVDDAYHADQHAVRYDQIGVWAMSTVLTVSAAAVFAAVILCKNRAVPKVDKKYWGPLILRCVCGTFGDSV